jgi:hypothetical protein
MYGQRKITFPEETSVACHFDFFPINSALFLICSACLGAKLFHAVARASKRPHLQTVFLNGGKELCPAKVIAP